MDCSVGLVAVACPRHVHEKANPLPRGKMITVLRVANTLGGVRAGRRFMAALVVLCAGERNPCNQGHDRHISGRARGLAVMEALLPLLLVFLGVFSMGTRVMCKKGVVGALNRSEYSFHRLLVAVWCGHPRSGSPASSPCPSLHRSWCRTSTCHRSSARTSSLQGSLAVCARVAAVQAVRGAAQPVFARLVLHRLPSSPL